MRFDRQTHAGQRLRRPSFSMPIGHTALMALKIPSCHIDGVVIVCDERGVAVCPLSVIGKRCPGRSGAAITNLSLD